MKLCLKAMFLRDLK